MHNPFTIFCILYSYTVYFVFHISSDLFRVIYSIMRILSVKKSAPCKAFFCHSGKVVDLNTIWYQQIQDKCFRAILYSVKMPNTILYFIQLYSVFCLSYLIKTSAPELSCILWRWPTLFCILYSYTVYFVFHVSSRQVLQSYLVFCEDDQHCFVFYTAIQCILYSISHQDKCLKAFLYSVKKTNTIVYFIQLYSVFCISYFIKTSAPKLSCILRR